MKQPGNLTKKRILITCGPTWVKIDDVRIIGNCSTGSLGHLLATEITKAGGKVTLIEGPVANRLQNPAVKVIPFTFFEQLESIIRKEGAKSYDAVIHAAAVSDYHLDNPYPEKISSRRKQLVLKLTPTPKLIKYFKKLNSKCFLIGFKLESKLTPDRFQEIALALKTQANCDLVIANTISNQNGYQGFILNSEGTVFDQASSRKSMAKKITKHLEENL